MHGTQKLKWLYPTAFSSWDEREQEAIQRVVASGRFTMGEEVEAFEAEFAAYHGMKYGTMVNSGSSANLIMIATLFNLRGRPPLRRHEVALVPALAWSTTYAPLVQYGLELEVVDCDASWCYDPIQTDTKGCRLAVGVSVLGVPADLKFLKNAIESNNGYFIEDNCESLGAKVLGRKCGTMGLMNSFSFFYSHQISAIEGGMILTNDVECDRLCRILRAHGWTRDVSPPTSLESEYNFTHFGYNVRPLEMHAAIARVQLRKLDDFVAARRANLELFARLTQSLPVQLQRGAPVEASPFGLAFTVASSEARSRLASALRERGIDCRLPTGGSFRKHPYGARWADQATPVADRIHETGLFLGNAPYGISPEIETAVEVMREVLV